VPRVTLCITNKQKEDKYTKHNTSIIGYFLSSAFKNIPELVLTSLRTPFSHINSGGDN